MAITGYFGENSQLVSYLRQIVSSIVHAKLQDKQDALDLGSSLESDFAGCLQPWQSSPTKLACLVQHA